MATIRQRYARNVRKEIMSTPVRKIKKLLFNNEITIAALAKEYEQQTGRRCRREEMSMCINGIRIYPDLREFLEEKFNQRFWSKSAKAA
jgi:hypothetical protein